MSVERVKARLNEIYRCHLVLDYYQSSLLPNSKPTEKGLATIKEKQKICVDEGKKILDKINAITKKEKEMNKYTDALYIVSDLITSEFFYDAKALIDELLEMYEKNITPLLKALMINPLDQLQVPKLNFV